MIEYSAGIVTAYGSAVRAGYTGTYEDFCRQQAQYAENAQAVEQAKTDAQTARNQAQTAKDDAVTAKNNAVSAKDDAVSAKDDAVSAKNTATTKAQEASQSATNAGQSATSAEASARASAQSADDAEQSAQSVSGSLAQIQTNKEDIDTLKADLDDNVNAINGDRNSVSELYDITYLYNRNGYILTNGGVGNPVSLTPVTNYGWVYFVIPVKVGDRFEVTGTGSGGSRQWALLDDSNILLSVANNPAPATSTVIAESDGTLVCNFQTNESYSLKYTGYIGMKEAINNRFGNIEDAMTYKQSMSAHLIENGYLPNNVNKGESVGNTKTSNNSWLCMSLRVKRGEVYEIHGEGGGNARLWSTINRYSRLIDKAESNATGIVTITIPEDGYLIYNTQKVVDFGVYKIGTAGFCESVTDELSDVEFAPWNTKTKPPYWVLSLDTAKKYFTIDNIKTIIDRMSINGFNQLQLHLSTDTGFRFELTGNMVFDGLNGQTYDLAQCLGGVENPTKWYTKSDMDTIISYARSKGIEVYPLFEMPAHMGYILNVFTQFRSDAPGTLDYTNPDAVHFATEIAKRYARYFSSRNCHFYNIGFDEVNAFGGFADIYANGGFGTLTEFANTLISTIKENGLQPRIYNEAVYYNVDYKYQISKDVEVLAWKYAGSPYAKPLQLQNAGYKVVNSSSWFYYIDSSGFNIPVETLRTLNLMKYYGGFSNYFSHTVFGAVMSVWCDRASTTNPGDGGDAVLVDVLPMIDVFGDAIKTTKVYIGM